MTGVSSNFNILMLQGNHVALGVSSALPGMYDRASLCLLSAPVLYSYHDSNPALQNHYEPQGAALCTDQAVFVTTAGAPLSPDSW